MMAKQKKLPPIHPGEVLKEEFIEPLAITSYRVAKDTHTPATRISEIIKGRRSITADTALRFSRYFGTTPEFWLNLQSRYDLEMAEDRLGDSINEVKPLAA